jgi:hypothetical protein
VPSERNSVDDGTCDTSRQNDIRKSETEQTTKAKAMQQSIFPRPVGLGVIQEPFLSGHPKAANEGHLKTGQRK